MMSFLLTLLKDSKYFMSSRFKVTKSAKGTNFLSVLVRAIPGLV